jgi:hypothetical protein
LEPAITGSVVRLLISMMATVDFDDEPLFEANEVNDVRVKRLLTPELVASEPSVS